jgi:hypothetical protein
LSSPKTVSIGFSQSQWCAHDNWFTSWYKYSHLGKFQTMTLRILIWILLERDAHSQLCKSFSGTAGPPQPQDSSRNHVEGLQDVSICGVWMWFIPKGSCAASSVPSCQCWCGGIFKRWGLVGGDVVMSTLVRGLTLLLRNRLGLAGVGQFPQEQAVTKEQAWSLLLSCFLSGYVISCMTSSVWYHPPCMTQQRPQ